MAGCSRSASPGHSLNPELSGNLPNPSGMSMTTPARSARTGDMDLRRTGRRKAPGRRALAMRPALFALGGRDFLAGRYALPADPAPAGVAGLHHRLPRPWRRRRRTRLPNFTPTVWEPPVGGAAGTSTAGPAAAVRREISVCLQAGWTHHPRSADASWPGRMGSGHSGHVAKEGAFTGPPSCLSR